MKEKFLKEKMINEWLSLSSIRSYESLFYHIEQDERLDLKNIEATFNLENILNFFQKKSEIWQNTTYNFYIKKFRVFLKFLDREKNIWKIYENLKFKKIENKLPKFIENDQLQEIFKILNLKEKNILKIFLYTGMRRFEFAWVKKENINFERWEIKIFWKNRKWRIIPIHSEILDILKKFDFPISLCKIDFIREKIQKIYPDFKIHNLRHTFATSLIRSKVDLYSISKIMWHSNINTTTTYLSLVTENMKKEIEKIKFDL